MAELFAVFNSRFTPVFAACADHSALKRSTAGIIVELPQNLVLNGLQSGGVLAAHALTVQEACVEAEVGGASLYGAAQEIL